MVPEIAPDVAGEQPQAPAPEAAAQPEDELIASDLLIEDVSIDGMCGVY